MKETPPNTSLHHINHTPGVHIKPFFTGTPFRRELQSLFCRTQKQVTYPKITKGACDKGFQQ